MAYDDKQAKRSRVVVETPTSRREVTHTEAVRNDSGGISGATVGVIVVVAIALITVVSNEQPIHGHNERQSCSAAATGAAAGNCSATRPAATAAGDYSTTSASRESASGNHQPAGCDRRFSAS